MNTVTDQRFFPREDPREKTLTEAFVDALRDNTRAGLHPWRQESMDCVSATVDGRKLILTAQRADHGRERFHLISQEPSTGAQIVLMMEECIPEHPSQLRDLYQTVEETLQDDAPDPVIAHMRNYLQKDHQRQYLLRHAGVAKQCGSAPGGTPAI